MMKKAVMNIFAAAVAAALFAGCSEDAIELREAAYCTPFSEYETFETEIVDSPEKIPDDCSSLMIVSREYYDGEGWNLPEIDNMEDDSALYGSYVMEYYDHTDISFYEYMLIIDGTETDGLLAEIALMPDITRLGIIDSEVSGIEVFSHMEKLETLYLFGTGPVLGSSFKAEERPFMDTDFSGEFSSLKDMTIDSFDIGGKLGDIGKISSLERLNLPNCGLKSLKGTEKLTSLSRLNIYGNEISSLEPLSSMTQLTALSAAFNNITSIEPLKSCVNLEILEVGMANNLNLEPLSELKKLETLNLFKSGVTDLSPLSGLTELENLNLIANGVSDLSPLSGLTKLRMLLLHNNNISDLSPLNGLEKLEKIYVGNNPVRDISPVKGLPRLSTFSSDEESFGEDERWFL